jgi:hypothetical protein
MFGVMIEQLLFKPTAVAVPVQRNKTVFTFAPLRTINRSNLLLLAAAPPARPGF